MPRLFAVSPPPKSDQHREELARSARTSRLDRSAAFFFWDPERSKAWALKGTGGHLGGTWGALGGHLGSRVEHVMFM